MIKGSKHTEEAKQKNAEAHKGNRNALGHTNYPCASGCGCKKHFQSKSHIESRAKGVIKYRALHPPTEKQLSAALLNLDGARRILLQQFRPITKPHKQLYEWLISTGYSVELEKNFGRYYVDCYLPEYHLAFEADGAYWHNRPEIKRKDSIRDAKLLTIYALPVVRFSDSEIRELING